MEHDGMTWKVDWKVDKFDDNGTLYETIEDKGNLLMYGGASALWDLLIAGGTATAFDNTNARLGVGNGTTAAAATQTDLQGASKVRVAMDSTYPQHTDGTAVGNASIVFKSTFGSGVGEFAWEEWGLFNAASAGRMLNRKVASLGTKASGSWELTVTITLS